MRQGEGIYHYADGRKYYGAINQNKKDGLGIFTKPSGERYEG